MKEIVFLLLTIFLFSGCMSEAERQAQISQLNLQLEQERQRLDIPKDVWQEYVTHFKDRKCAGWEYQWGRNWRYWAIKDAEKYFQQNSLMLERSRLSITETLLRNEVESLNQKYESLNSCITDFVKGLSDDELKVYEKISSQNQTNPATVELNKRRLDNVMSQENKKMFEQILREATNLEAEKALLVGKIDAHDKQVAVYNQKLITLQQAVAIREQRNREAIQAFGKDLQQQRQRSLQEAQIDYYTRPYKIGGVIYIPARR
ncbi:MAG: hypothetical protein ACYS30_19820 [Planctomycetota bacterium]|jgi:hypothetical protein